MKTRYYKSKSINECVSPIFTGSDEKCGVSLLLRNISIYNKKKGILNIPYIHGNSIRGFLRRLIMKDFIDIVDYKINNKKLYHSLFSGGLLEQGKDSGVIDLQIRRKITNNIPSVSLFGCAFSNQMIQGKMSISHMFPICKEYCEFLPDNLNDDRTQINIRQFIDNTFITRRDDIKDKDEDDQAIQMKIDYECLIPGTGFYHEFIIELPNDIELSCFARIIELWKSKTVIGAKSNVGEGKLKIDYDCNKTSKKYIDYLKKNKEHIHNILKELEKLL